MHCYRFTLMDNSCIALCFADSILQRKLIAVIITNPKNYVLPVFLFVGPIHQLLFYTLIGLLLLVVCVLPLFPLPFACTVATMHVNHHTSLPFDVNWYPSERGNNKKDTLPALYLLVNGIRKEYTFACRDNNGLILNEPIQIMERWKQYFQTSLGGTETLHSEISKNFIEEISVQNNMIEEMQDENEHPQ